MGLCIAASDSGQQRIHEWSCRSSDVGEQTKVAMEEHPLAVVQKSAIACESDALHFGACLHWRGDVMLSSWAMKVT